MGHIKDMREQKILADLMKSGTVRELPADVAEGVQDMLKEIAPRFKKPSPVGPRKLNRHMRRVQAHRDRVKP